MAVTTDTDITAASASISLRHRRRPGHNYWRKHVRWCSKHYDSYNPNTNTFKTVHGRIHCDSPFM